MTREIPDEHRGDPDPTGAGEPAELESPSLFADGAGGPPAFELKFHLTEEQARAVEARVRGRLALDPHADPAMGNAYLTTSLYTDTPAYDVLRRTTAVGGRKHRVRRYGDAGPIYVEEKTKKGDRVRKRRAPALGGDLAALADGDPHAEWPGRWFVAGVALLGLRPVCRISYDRTAYMGAADDGAAVRVTFDRRVRGEPAAAWDVHPVAAGADLLAGKVICEFKFRLALPPLFKGVVADLGLAPGAVSKYRLFMATTGALPGGPADV